MYPSYRIRCNMANCDAVVRHPVQVFIQLTLYYSNCIRALCPLTQIATCVSAKCTMETALTSLNIRDIRRFVPVSRRRSILIEDALFLCATLSARDGWNISDRSIRPIAPVWLSDGKYYRVTTNPIKSCASEMMKRRCFNQDSFF